jgi:adhesin transport system outer membrane protein
VLTPQTAVSLAIARHPEILGAEAAIARRQAEVALAEAARWPTIQYSLGPGYGSSYGASGNEAAVRASLGIDQPLWDFGATKGQIAAAKEMVDSARLARLDTVEQVAQVTLAAYAEATAARERVAVAGEAITAMQQVQQRISQRSQAGVTDRSDVNTAGIAVQRAQIDAEQALTSAEGAMSRLIELIGVGAERLVSLEQVRQQVAARGRAASFDFETAPAIAAARQALEAADERVKVARAQQYPALGIGVSRTLSTGRASANDGTWIGLSVRGSLSLGGAARQRVAATRAERSMAEQQLEAKRLEARTGWQVAVREERGALRRIASLGEVLTLWSTTRDLYWQEYIINKRTLSDVINAEREIHAVRSEGIGAVADAATAGMRVLVAQGELVALLDLQQSPARDAATDRRTP